MTIRLKQDLKLHLDKLSKTTYCSKLFFATEADCDYSELDEWQIDEIKSAIKEADMGDFASEHEVNDVFGKLN